MIVSATRKTLTFLIAVSSIAVLALIFRLKFGDANKDESFSYITSHSQKGKSRDFRPKSIGPLQKTIREAPDPSRNQISEWQKETSIKRLGPLADFRDSSYNTEKFSTFSFDGKLTLESIVEAGLSSYEANEIQKIVDSHRAKMKELILTSMSANNDLPNGVSASFIIDDFSGQGESEFRNFIDKVDQSIGVEKRKRLMSGFSVVGAYFNYGYSRTIINLLEKTPNEEPTQSVRVEIIKLDPASSRPIGRSTTYLSDFNSVFDGLLNDFVNPP
ncbi:hypothetical protein [Luteolibacter sp. Populi]|uniref:hypothetical protein n=1 Tax=Luteolibacter sp. Populi TaxID=3230487 RepID=UPI003467EBC6